MVATRLPAMRAKGIDLNKLVGSTGRSADGVLPDPIQWKAHNYNHLMEQPTVFYAVALTLFVAGWGTGLNAWLAWGYVAFRIAHSIVQATVNVVQIRFPLFALASLCLVGLTIHAAVRMLHDGGLLNF
jgi:hypothetical protein